MTTCIMAAYAAKLAFEGASIFKTFSQKFFMEISDFQN